jgi:hypothetical protein
MKRDSSRGKLDLNGIELYVHTIEQHALRNVNNCSITNTFSYLETSGGQSSNLYLDVVHFFNTSVN